jgi:transaldolase/glucose-6-phosphate isomerase
MNAPARRPSAKSAANPLAGLHQLGQAPWLDFLARKFIADGSLKTLVERDGVTGVTSNPSIFEKAIGESDDYDAALKSALGQGDRDVMSLYEALAIEDIRNATDVLLPVYKATKGADGYVSLEVSPYLAMDTEATVAEAQRLWRAVSRDNMMIKVPATEAGLPAIRRLIGEGINVNITLLFSQEVYEQVVEAYLGGLEDLLARGGDPSKVASVASFFVSRIDVAVDRLLDDKIKSGRKELSSLRGKVAIANAKLAYQRYKRLFAGSRWDKLKSKGARTQRLLWASTGTKNKEYSDVLYVDGLIADDTVNTLPPSTMDAFRDHGKLSDSLEKNIDDAKDVMAKLAQAGISIDAVTQKLVEEGVQLFADAFDKLLGAVAHKRAVILGKKLDAQTYKLPDELGKAVKATLEEWRSAGKIRQLWTGDAGLWTNADEAKWVGWLNIVAEQSKRLGELKALTQDVRKQGFTHAVLLGMGGSSLGPEVLAETFGGQDGGAQLCVLDSTDPAQVRTVESKCDPARTLFIVSSKSGSTLEPNVLKDYFFDRVKAAVGADAAGSHFMAITDPGSSLETQAKRDRFRHIFHGEPSIGGRYSVLSDFGLVPAAVMGLDLQRLLDTTALMVRSCGRHVPPAENPGVVLGAILGNAAKAGRDKVTIIASQGIADFGAWLEQLLAESTGKHGKGLVPVDAEPLGEASAYGKDRVFAYLRLASKPDAKQDDAVRAIEAAGHPVVRIEVTDTYHIGQEFFRWEMATAVAGAVIGINPFDQPDVEASKVQTKELTSAYEKTGSLPPEKPFFEAGGISLFAPKRGVEALGKTSADKPSTLTGYLSAHLKRLKSGDYFALLAYIERNGQHGETLQDIRRLVRDHYKVATCLGFGPRFLHSTGQAYKGGPDSGVFLQITCDDATDVAIPGRKYSFGTVKAAEARGDFEVLAKRGRRALRVHIGSHVAEGLSSLKDAIREALG